MQSVAQTAPVSRKKVWAGHIISGLAVLFLLMEWSVQIGETATGAGYAGI